MKFRINGNTFMEHLMLQDQELCTEVASTVDWTEHGIIEAKLEINNIPVAAEHFESFMKTMWEQMESHMREKYDADNLDRTIEQRAMSILEDRAEGVIEKLDSLRLVLEDSSDTIKPYWDK